jgi:hypothetical protein
MPIYRNAGGGAPIRTSSEIFDYSTGNGGSKPRYGKHGSTDSIQHRLQAPIEAPKYMNDKTPPRDAPSGSNFSGPASGSRSGKTAYPGYSASNRGAPLDRGVKQGIPNRNSFTQTFGKIGSGVGRKMRPATDV